MMWASRVVAVMEMLGADVPPVLDGGHGLRLTCALWQVTCPCALNVKSIVSCPPLHG